MSLTRRSNASAIASMFSAIGALMSIFPRARGPTAILRMYMSGSVTSEPASPTAIIDIAPSPPRAPPARSHARRTRRCTARAGRPVPPRPFAEPSRSYALQLLGGGEDELDHSADGLAHIRILDHRDTVLARTFDEQVLDQANVDQPLEVLLHRPHPVRGGIPNPEVRSVLLFLPDPEHAFDHGCV